MPRVGRVCYPLEFLPTVAIEVRKTRITGEFGMDNGEVNTISPRQRLPIKAGPADDKYLVVLKHRCQRGLNRSDDDKTFGTKARIIADDEINAIAQRSAEGLAGFSSHDDVVPAGQGAKALEISRQVPRYDVVDADDAVFGDSSDQ